MECELQKEKLNNYINEVNDDKIKKRKLDENEKYDINKKKCIEPNEQNKKNNFFNIFNTLFNWINRKNIKIPSIEIESINVNFFNFNNVITKSLGTKILFVTDESKGKTENILIQNNNGWITRRRRDVGHEWAILKLKYPCIIYGIEINFEDIEEDDVCPHLSIEVVNNSCIDHVIKEKEMEYIDTEKEYIENENTENIELDDKKKEKKKERRNYNFIESYRIDKAISDLLDMQKTPWIEILHANSVNFLKNIKKKKNFYFQIIDEKLYNPCTYVRINLYPDGGLNRLKLYGQYVNVFKKQNISKQKIFLNKPENGCTLIYHNYNHIYKGHPKNLIDIYKINGFCTKRLLNRPPIIFKKLTNKMDNNNNIAIFKFGFRAIVENFTFDISTYKYDYPEYIQIYLLDCIDITDLDLIEQKKIFQQDEKLINKKIDWFKLPPCKLNINSEKTFYSFNLLEHDFTVMERTATHFKISLLPDGGITQVNIIGTILDTA